MPNVDLHRLNSVLGRASEALVFSDHSTALRGVLVIETTRGSTAIGGTRFMPYPSVTSALTEMGEFAQAVTYKGVLSGLPCGGAKGAIIGDPETLKSDKLLRAFGRFVQSLGGRYTLTPDWGMSPNDLAIVASECEFVTGISGGTEVLTALGVVEGIKAANIACGNTISLAGLRIGVEGLGMAGPDLIGLLIDEGAIVTAADSDAALRARIAAQYPNVKLLDSTAALQASDLDVYCPCAGSGSLTSDLADSKKLRIVCGAANGQLANPAVEQAFVDRGVLYVPEFAANGGGLVYCFEETIGFDHERANKRIKSISSTVVEILNRARHEDRLPTSVALQVAEERLAASEFR